MKYDLNFLPTNATDKDIFEEVRRVDRIVNKPFLSHRDFDKHSKIDSSILRHRFGSWRDVLAKSGLGNKYSGPEQISEKVRQQHWRRLSDEQILDELRRIAKHINKKEITTVDIEQHSELIGPKILTSRFGSWRNGVKKAGLKVSVHGHRWTDDEYFKNVLNVWTHYGRQPLYREMDLAPSEITVQGYRHRFGGWRRALEAFVARMGQDETNNAEKGFKKEDGGQVRKEIARHGVAIEDKRSIPLGLRYKTLSRDSFKCARCGASPSKDPRCTLHIDHIIPFSKQGRTTLENLQTLCESCNLGKGNRHLE